MAEDNIPGAPELGAKTNVTEKDSVKVSTPEPSIEAKSKPTPEVESATPPETPEPLTKKDFTPPKKPRSKKLWLIGGLLVLIVVAAVAWLMMGKKVASPGTNTATSSQSQTSVSTNTYIPTAVVYAFKGDDHSPYTLYTRPVGGGDRTAANIKLTANDTIDQSDVEGQTVALAITNDVFVSTDGGKTYKSILKINQNPNSTVLGNQITSLKISTDGQHIVYGWLTSDSNKNEVKAMDLNGQNTKTLFTSTSRGVFITSYSSKANKIVYSEGCYNCDGNTDSPVVRDLTTNKVTKIASSTSSLLASQAVPNSDFTKLIYSTSTIDNTQTEGLGYATTGPYTINLFDLASNKTTKLTTFGTKGEKNPNGTARQRNVYVGFVAGSSTPYYTNDSQLFEIKSGKSSLVYEASKPILELPFVGSELIVVGGGDQTADYVLSSYNIPTKKSTKIYSGDNNTYLFGVTTK